MIFDTIYNFYFSLFTSADDISVWWSNWIFMDFEGNPIYGFDYLSVVATVITIVFGIFALFRILGGVLRLFKV